MKLSQNPMGDVITEVIMSPKFEANLFSLPFTIINYKFYKVRLYWPETNDRINDIICL